jgi:hypothetical protein
MFSQVFNYNPKEQDYRVWLVVNPRVWLIPILALVLLTALTVHTYILGSGKYNFLAEAEAVVAEEPAAVAAAPAAAAEEAEAPAAEAPAAE